MSLESLLNAEINNGKTILTIDEPTRTIKYDGGSLLLGVEGDIDAERIYFQIPTLVGDGIPPLNASTDIFIDFTNGQHETYTSQSLDADDYGDYVEFSWLLDSRIAVVAGEVIFRVRVVNTEDDGSIREWHTANFVAKVLDGIDVDDSTQEIPVEMSSIAKLEQKTNEFMEMAAATMDGFELEGKEIIEQTKQEVIDTVGRAAYYGYNYITYKSVDCNLVNAAINSYVDTYTTIDQCYLSAGNYSIEIEIPEDPNSTGTGPNLIPITSYGHDYSGTYLFKGYIHAAGPFGDQLYDENASNNKNYYDNMSFKNASILYGPDVVLGYRNITNLSTYEYTNNNILETSVVFGKLALVLLNDSSDSKVQATLLLIENDGTRSPVNGTIKTVYRESLSLGMERMMLKVGDNIAGKTLYFVGDPTGGNPNGFLNDYYAVNVSYNGGDEEMGGLIYAPAANTLVLSIPDLSVSETIYNKGWVIGSLALPGPSDGFNSITVTSIINKYKDSQYIEYVEIER